MRLPRLLLVAAFVVLIPAMMRSHETTTTTVLFDREIVRILNEHCVACHADGAISFPLSTYEQTWLRGRSIRSEILKRHMPPWAAMPGYGQFVNDNSLTLREVQFLVSWVEGLGPRNSGTVFLNVLDPNARPRDEVKALPHTEHWQLGQPGLTRTLDPNTIEAGQPDQVRRIVIDPGLKTERRVRAIEFMPGDRRVIRGATFTIQETGQWLGSWTPWYGYALLPTSASYRLPSGAHIVAEIHYRGTKERVVDQGTLGLFFASAPTVNSVSDLVVEAKGDVAPGSKSQRFQAQSRLTTNISALALRAETFAGAQSIELSARRPDGGTQILLFAKDMPVDWPTPYVFKDAVRLSAGTVLTATVYYGNAGVVSQQGGFRMTISRY